MIETAAFWLFWWLVGCVACFGLTLLVVEGWTRWVNRKPSWCRRGNCPVCATQRKDDR